MVQQYMVSGVVIDLEPINDNLTVVNLYSIEEDTNELWLFYKRLDKKYIGKVVDITARSLNENGYLEEIIESADDSDKIELTEGLKNEIMENYERLGI